MPRPSRAPAGGARRAGTGDRRAGALLHGRRRHANDHRDATRVRGRAVHRAPAIYHWPVAVNDATASAVPTATGLELTLEKTEVRDSTLSQLPGLGFVSTSLPTNAFDALSNALQLTPDASTVQLLRRTQPWGASDATEGGYLLAHERHGQHTTVPPVTQGLADAVCAGRNDGGCAPCTANGGFPLATRERRTCAVLAVGWAASTSAPFKSRE